MTGIGFGEHWRFLRSLDPEDELGTIYMKLRTGFSSHQTDKQKPTPNCGSKRSGVKTKLYRCAPPEAAFGPRLSFSNLILHPANEMRDVLGPLA